MNNFNIVRDQLNLITAKANKRLRKDIEQLKDSIFQGICYSMDSNGFSYMNEKAFITQSDEPCYIPESATTINHIYTYEDLKIVVKNWCEENPEYLNEHETTADAILINMWENNSHLFPETYLNELN